MSEQTVFQAQTEHNLKRLRAATLLAYLVAFSLLAAAVTYGAVRVRNAHRHLQSVMEQYNHKIALITETQIASFQRSEALQQLILETDPFAQDEVYLAFLNAGFRVGDGRNKIRARLETDAERAALAKQDAVIYEIAALHDRVADLAQRGEFAAARQIFIDQLRALHVVGHQAFAELRELQTDAAQAAVAEANQAYQDTLRHSVIAVILGLLGGISIGIAMYRASSRIANRVSDNVDDLRRMAMHDGLTGLLNRTAMTQKIDELLEQRKPFAILYMDLDGFKKVNDDHGHNYGDNLLMMAAARIRGRIRGVDSIARMGGDEFVGLLNGIGDQEEAVQVARHIIEAFEPAFVHEGIETPIGLSIGVCLAPRHGRFADDILHKADRAMYRAKNRGHNCFEVHGTQPGLVIHDGSGTRR